MRILLDESAPRALKGLLPGHDVETAPERGWASIRNGALLQLAVDAGFDVFLTADTSMPHQQNLERFDIAVVVLDCGSNRMSTYRACAEELRGAVEAANRKEAHVFTA